MATQPIGGDAAAVTLPGTLPPMPAVARILRQFDRDKIGAAIEVMIALLDAVEPDPEAEPGAWPEDLRAVDQLGQPDDAETAGDEQDASWLEWTSLNATRQRQGVCRVDSDGHEDDEEDDVAEDDDPAGQCDEDGVNVPVGAGRGEFGPGCPIGDPGERWQDTFNVPMPETVTLAHNIFTDRRVDLGVTNLQSSYRPFADGVRSADSGRLFRRRRGAIDNQPGQPV